MTSRWAETACVWAVPVVLLLVAAWQIVLVKTTRLSPWKGGGFGMFSTIDAPDDRVVSARVTISGEEYPVELSGPLAAARDRVLAQPTEAHGRQVLARLLDASWELREHRGGSADAERRFFAMPAESGAGSSPAGAHVEVCRMRFDGRTNRLSTQLLLSLDGSPRR
jgi:hypothetical protein